MPHSSQSIQDGTGSRTGSVGKLICNLEFVAASQRTLLSTLSPVSHPQVYRQTFWLGLFEGAISPKRLAIMSNSPLIAGLDLGTLTKEKRALLPVKTTRTKLRIYMFPAGWPTFFP